MIPIWNGRLSDNKIQPKYHIHTHKTSTECACEATYKKCLPKPHSRPAQIDNNDDDDDNDDSHTIPTHTHTKNCEAHNMWRKLDKLTG